jgi:hypothetical protein
MKLLALSSLPWCAADPFLIDCRQRGPERMSGPLAGMEVRSAAPGTGVENV